MTAELMSAWIHGWALSRHAPAPVAVDGGFRVDVGEPNRSARYALDTRDRMLLDRLDRDTSADRVDVKILGFNADLRSWLPDTWTVYPTCTLMTVDLTVGETALPEPYTARIDQQGGVLVASIRDAGKDVVASGRLALVGRYAMFDQVGTRPLHRRRGLAAGLMTMLGNRAMAEGPRTGVLDATDDGRALYRRLGWADRGEIAGAIRSKA